MKTTAVLCFLAGLIPISTTHAADIDRAQLPGIWKLEKKNLVAKAAMYTVIVADGNCGQVAKASLVGTTHWATDQCAWVLDGDKLTMKVVFSASHPDKVGEVSTIVITDLDATTMAYITKDDDAESMTRVGEVPTEFAEKLAQDVAAQLAAGATK
ncbi:MAG: hypothetical protein M3O62_09705 [Pseudomonadota bacterium]|nr:hypothetical protein [Pseudomonadota bacterium]